MRRWCLLWLTCAPLAAPLAAEKPARASSPSPSVAVVASIGSAPGGEDGLHTGVRASESAILYDGTSRFGRIGLFAGLGFAWSNHGTEIDATDSYALNQYGLELQSGIFMPLIRADDCMANVDLGVNLGYGLAHGRRYSDRPGGADSDSGSYLMGDVFLRHYLGEVSHGQGKGIYATVGYRIQAVSLPHSSFDDRIDLRGGYACLGFGVFF